MKVIKAFLSIFLMLAFALFFVSSIPEVKADDRTCFQYAANFRCYSLAEHAESFQGANPNTDITCTTVDGEIGVCDSVFAKDQYFNCQEKKGPDFQCYDSEEYSAARDLNDEIDGDIFLGCFHENGEYSTYCMKDLLKDYIDCRDFGENYECYTEEFWRGEGRPEPSIPVENCFPTHYWSDGVFPSGICAPRDVVNGAFDCVAAFGNDYTCYTFAELVSLEVEGDVYEVGCDTGKGEFGYCAPAVDGETVDDTSEEGFWANFFANFFGGEDDDVVENQLPTIDYDKVANSFEQILRNNNFLATEEEISKAKGFFRDGIEGTSVDSVSLEENEFGALRIWAWSNVEWIEDGLDETTLERISYWINSGPPSYVLSLRIDEGGWVAVEDAFMGGDIGDPATLEEFFIGEASGNLFSLDLEEMEAKYKVKLQEIFGSEINFKAALIAREAVLSLTDTDERTWYTDTVEKVPLTLGIGIVREYELEVYERAIFHLERFNEFEELQ